MNYQTYSPPGTLKPFVQYFWTLENGDVDSSPKTFGAVADGCPGIMFQQSDKSAFCDETNKQLPDIMLYGQTVRPTKFTSSGKLSTIGICFYPHALQSVFGLQADELTNSCVNLDLLPRKKEASIAEQLVNTHSPIDQIKLLSDYLFTQVEKNSRKTDNITQYALSAILQSKGDVSFKELQAYLQLSERSLERKFKQSVGISPKLFSRICRFQESLNQMRHNKYDKLSDIAYENGYADQSHFIRSFKEFAGFSPFDFKKQSNEVVANFPQLIQ